MFVPFFRLNESDSDPLIFGLRLFNVIKYICRAYTRVSFVVEFPLHCCQWLQTSGYTTSGCKQAVTQQAVTNPRIQTSSYTTDSYKPAVTQQAVTKTAVTNQRLQTSGYTTEGYKQAVTNQWLQTSSYTTDGYKQGVTNQPIQTSDDKPAVPNQRLQTSGYPSDGYNPTVTNQRNIVLRPKICFFCFVDIEPMVKKKMKSYRLLSFMVSTTNKLLPSVLDAEKTAYRIVFW